MPATTYRQSPRLKGFDYEGPLAAHVVLATRKRELFFTEQHLAGIVIDALQRTAERYQATLHAYCVMPDHLHLLVEIPEGVSLPKVVRWFKQMTGFELKQVTGSSAWQVSYYEHVLRKEEALADVARYVWNNPVVDGLTEDWTQYPHSGPRDLIDQYGAMEQV